MPVPSTSPTDPSHAPRAGARQWLALAVLVLAGLILSLDFTGLYLALPALGADLGASGTQSLWILDIYGFLLAGFLVTMGAVGDRVGRRRLLLAGAAAFAAASLAAAFATSPGMLIAGRALLGVAGATFVPSAMAMIGALFADPRQRALAFALWMAGFQAGMALGPVVGGLLLSAFWWGSVFLPGLPVMALLLVLGPRILPEPPRGEKHDARVDVRSAAMSLAAVLLAVYGLKELAHRGFGPLPAAALAGGAAVGALFVRRQARLTHPLLDLGLFRLPSVGPALVAFAVPGVIGGGAYLLTNVHLQDVAGLGPRAAGLCLVPGGAAMVAGSLAAPHLARRFAPHRVIAAGFAAVAAGYLILTTVDAGGGVPVLIASGVVCGLGVGPATGLLPNLVVGAAPPERAGSAAALMQTMAEVCIAAGVAVLGTLGGAVYRDRLSAALPDGVPAHAASSAREGLTQAGAAAAELPPGLADAVLAAARGAFVDGFRVVAAVSAVTAALLAVLASRRLGR